MQIKGLHKNIYRLYAYARPQECLDAYRQKYQDRIRTWEKLKTEEVLDETCQALAGISRAPYYRHKKILKDLAKGKVPPSKRPKAMQSLGLTKTTKLSLGANGFKSIP